MTSIRASLASFLQDPENKTLRDALRQQSGAAEVSELWRQVREAPAHVESVATLLARLIGEGQEVSAILDAAQRCGQWAPRDESGDGVALLVAEVFWRLGHQPALAEPYMRRVKRADPANAIALAFYRELFAGHAQAAQLFQVLVHARRGAVDPDEQFNLASEAANLALTRLNDRERAIEVWRTFVREFPEHDRAREQLKTLYREGEKWNALVDLLKSELDRGASEATREVAGKITRWLELAELYREQLSLDAMENMALTRVLELDPAHPQALSRLADAHARAQRWNELVLVLDRLLAGAQAQNDLAAQRGVLQRMVDVWLTRVGNPARAVEPLLAVLRLDPSDATARQRLAAIYEQRRDWRSLLGLRRQGLRTQVVEDKNDSLAERLAIARLCEEKLGDRREAIGDWNAVLALEPAHHEALLALTRLYQREARWPHVVEILQRRIAATDDRTLAVELLIELARTCGEKLDQEARAIELWREVLRLEPGHERALRTVRDACIRRGDWEAVVELYAQQNLLGDVVDVLLGVAERQAESAVQIALYWRVAELCRTSLQAPERARAALERILLLEPNQEAALDALIPIYIEQANWARVSALHQRKLGLATDPTQRLHELDRLIEIADEHLHSPTLALQWCEQAYAFAPGDSARREALIQIAQKCGGWDVLVSALERRLSQSEVEPAERLQLLAQLAKLAQDELAKPEDAQRHYRAIAELNPHDTDALDALEKIYESMGRWEDLVAVKRQRLQGLSDPTQRIELLRRIHAIEHTKIQDLERAGQTLRELLVAAPEDRQALQAQLQNAKTRGAWEEFCQALLLVLASQDDPNAKVALLYELAQTKVHRLHQAAQGVDHLLAILALQPDHAGAVAELEALGTTDPEVAVACQRGLLPVYRRRGDKTAEARALQVLLANEKDTETRKSYRGVLAKLYESLPGREREAFALRLELFLESPDNWEARQALRRCAELTEAWNEAVGAYSQAIARVSQALGRVDHEEPATQRSLYALRRDLNLESAALYREKLRRPLDAEQCYREVFDQDESHQGAYEALQQLLSARGADAELLALYRRRVDAVFNPREQRDLLAKMVALAADRLGDVDTAIATAEELLELSPGDPAMIERLVALYRRRAAANDALRIDELLGSWAELVSESGPRLHLLFERANVRRSELDDVSGAVDLLAQIVAQEPNHTGAREALQAYLREPQATERVIQILEPLHRANGEEAALVKVLELKHEHALASGNLDVAVGALAKIAAIEERQLDRPERAFVVLRQVIALDPARGDLLDDLERLAERIGRFDVLAHELEHALLDISLRREVRIDLARRLARILDTKVGDVQRARQAFRGLVSLRSEDLELQRQALVNLIRLERETQAWSPLIEALEQAQRLSPDRLEQVAYGVQIAQTHHHELHDLPAACESWRRVLEVQPGHESALAGLMQVYEAVGDYSRLAETVEEAVRYADEPRARAALWRQLAELRHQRLHDPAAAVDALRKVAELQNSRQEVEACLWKIAEIGQQTENWALCDDALRRLVSVVGNDANKIRVLTLLADLQNGPLQRPMEALEWLRRAIAQAPGDAEVLTRLRALVEVEEVAERALELLMPALARLDDLERLADVQEVHARRQPSGRRRLAALLAVVETYETRLGHNERAFAVACEALRDAVDQPELSALLDRVERLAGQAELAQPLFQAYEQVASRILDAELQRRVYATMGKVALGRLGWIQAARQAYEKVFERAPDDSEVAAALEWIYVREADYEALASLLARRAERNPKAEERDIGYLRAAQLRSQELSDHEGAIRLYERLSQETLAKPEIQNALEFLYEQTGRFRALAGHLNRKLAGQTGSSLVETHLRLGRLYGEQLDDPEEGLRHLAAALRLDPNHAVGTDELRRYLDDKAMRTRAASLLEPLFAAVQDWSGLIHIQEIRLEQAATKEQRVAILLKMARLHEDQLEDLEAAFDGYARVFREDPGNVYVRDQLARLSSVLHQAQRYARLLTEYIEGQPNDDPQLRQVIQEAATLWRGPGKRPEAAVALLQRLRRMRPDDTSVVPELIAALTEAQMWSELVDLYWHETEGQRAVQNKVRLLIELARLARTNLRDAAQAIRAYRKILDLQPEHEEARRGLEAALLEGRRFGELVDLLVERAARTGSREEKVALLLRVANVQVDELNDWDAGVDTLDGILEIHPAQGEAIRMLERIAHEHADARTRVHALLYPLYEAARNWSKIADILQWRLASTVAASERQELYRNLAALAERSERNGLRTAFEWLSKALGEPGDGKSLALLDHEIVRLAEALGRPEAALQAWTVAADSPALADDAERRTDLLLRAGQGLLAIDVGRAAEVLRRATRLSPDHEGALALLDQTLERLGATPELVEVLQHRIQVTHDTVQELALVRRLGRLLASIVGQDPIPSWKRVLELEPTDQEALLNLTTLYDKPGSQGELIEILRQRVALALTGAERRELNLRLATLLRESLHDREGEVERLRAVLAEFPSDPVALRALATAFLAGERHHEAADALGELAAHLSNSQDRADVLLQRAVLCEEKLDDASEAVAAYAQVLAQVPGHPNAVAALVRLAADARVAQPVLEAATMHFPACAAWAEWIAVARARIEHSEDLDEKQRLVGSIADVYEFRLHDAQSAVQAALLQVDRARSQQLALAVDSLLTRAQRHDRLDWALDELSSRVQNPDADHDQRIILAQVVAKWSRDVLGDLDRAIAVLAWLVQAKVADLAVCDEVVVLARASSQPKLEILALHEACALDLAADSLAAQRRSDLGLACLRSGDFAGAIAALREALELDPSLDAALAGLETTLERNSGHPSSELLDTLDVVYAARSDQAGLARVLKVRLKYAAPEAIPSLLQALGALLDQIPAPDDEVLAVWGRLLTLEPLHPHALARVLAVGGDARLAAQAGELLLAATRQARALDLPCAGLALAAAKFWLDELREPAKAGNALDLALAQSQPDVEVHTLAVEVARAIGEPRRLHDALVGLAAIEAAQEGKVRHLREAAKLATSTLAEPALARRDWETLLDLDESDPTAWEELEKIVAADAPALANVLARRIAATPVGSLRQGLLLRRAELLAQDPAQQSQAIDILQELLLAARQSGGDVADLVARLEPLLTASQRWSDLIDLWRIASEHLPAQRSTLLRKMAEGTRTHLNDLDEALRLLEEAAELASEHYVLLDQWLEEDKRWEELVGSLNHRRARLRAANDEAEERTVTLRLLNLLVGPIADPARALTLAEEWVKRDANDAEVLVLMVGLYESVGDEDALRDTLSRVIAMQPGGEVGARLCVRMARFADDAQSRLNYLERAFELAPGLALVRDPLIAELSQLAAWDQLQRMLERACDHTSDPAVQRDLVLRRIDVLTDHLHDYERALAVMATVYSQVQDDVELNRRIADTLYAVGRYDESQGMYRWLAEVLPSAKRSKQRAHVLSRLASAEIISGNFESALPRLEESYHLDPTNLEMLSNLGAAYEQAQRWQDALRIYRAMLLQNIERSGLIRRGDIYLRLAAIHVSLGEPNKAKAMLRRGLEDDANHPHLQVALAELESAP